MNLISIPALTNNYIWLLYNDAQQCLIIDPGEAEPVLQTLSRYNLSPVAILLTHNHQDHVNGVYQLLKYFSLLVYGPQETYSYGVTQIVYEGDSFTLLDRIFYVMELPGHTRGHIGFYSSPWLFCGDTMFSAGCGRIFEGTSKEMYNSLQKINRLPSNTLICAAHEYTLRNLNFAASILPQDSIITEYQRKIQTLLLKKQSSLPTTLSLERQINLFLRCHEFNLQNNLNIQNILNEEWRIFAKLRKKRDRF